MGSQVKLQVFDSLQKVFVDRLPEAAPFTGGTMLKNELFSCVIAFRHAKKIRGKYIFKCRIEGPLEDFAELRHIGHVPSLMPAYTGAADDYITTKPGLFPDVLEPVNEENEVFLTSSGWNSLWLLIRPEGRVPAGKYPVTFTMYCPEHDIFESIAFTVEILDAALPDLDLIYTEWFHADCIAQAHRVPVFSEAHWDIMERYLKLAVRYGVNMLYTPVFTPPLDTGSECERLTVQLVDVIQTDEGYAFGYERFDRWVDMAHRCGIRLLEISHLFTQWGASCAPKIIARTPAGDKRIFGWETSGDSREYTGFVRLFLRDFTKHIRALGLEKDVYFHVSDEPWLESVEYYKKAYRLMREELSGFPIIDAISNYEFYEQGLIEKPVPPIDSLEIFLKNGVKNLWTYYCSAQSAGVSNRFMAMPSYRNRIIGIQLYKYDIQGFMHWGYNFYNSGLSKKAIDPYYITDGDLSFPSGDAFLVYPYEDGAIESLRQVVFYEALQDFRALKLLERYRGRPYVMKLLEDSWEQDITFWNYPRNSAYLLDLRRKINEEIRLAVSQN